MGNMMWKVFLYSFLTAFIECNSMQGPFEGPVPLLSDFCQICFQPWDENCVMDLPCSNNLCDKMWCKKCFYQTILARKKFFKSNFKCWEKVECFFCKSVEITFCYCCLKRTDQIVRCPAFYESSCKTQYCYECVAKLIVSRSAKKLKMPFVFMCQCCKTPVCGSTELSPKLF